MMDWINLIANALWILGCAIALAALSYASWEASIYKSKLRRRLRRPKYQLALGFAGFLFCAGLAGTARGIPEVIIWGLLAAGFLGLMALAYKQKRREDLQIKE